MNIAKKDVALAKRAAEERMQEFSVKIKPEDLEAYKLILKNIAENHSYAEGEKLSFDDSDILVEAARKMIRGMEKAFYNSSDDEKRKANVAGMIMAVNDYMMALAMEELNSPTIHDYCTDELEVIYRASASRLVERKPRKGYITSDAFESQRGMKAEELKDYKVDSLIKAMKDTPDDMDKGVELYLEYQALAKRQENHGAIWRFFHRKENDARTALLNEMKEAMAGKVSKETLRDHYTILESQRGINAAELKNGRVNDLINAIKADPDNMEKVADLYVEYQALAKRQENHGAIWRFFHREENDARTALLNEMKEAMAGKVSEKDLNDLYAYPSSIILNADEEETLKAIEVGLNSRERNPEKGFGYFKYENESKEQLLDPSEISKSTSVEENKKEIEDIASKREEKPKEIPNEVDLETTVTEKKVRFTIDELSPDFDKTVDMSEPHQNEPTKELGRSIDSM